MAEAWKTVRVFISSTFRDMQAERDQLVRFVFPRLREELLKRRIHFVDVDLRWGVTADQDAFDLCMHEIEHCHPRFLCMLGGRYGWMPPPERIDAGFVDRLVRGEAGAGSLSPEDLGLFEEGVSEGRDLESPLYTLDPSLGQYVLHEKPREKAEVPRWDERCNRAVQVLLDAGYPESLRSITAAEIYHGALDRLSEPTFQYFYFRDPEVTSSIPPPDAATYCEEPESYGASALAKLKLRIRETEGVVQVAQGQTVKSQVPVFTYPCRWDPGTHRIVDLKEFGDRVYEDLLASVGAEFGVDPPEALGILEEENGVLEAFVEDRVGGYVLGSRRPIWDALREHAAGTGGNPYLLVAGDPGSGKSALLGRFYRELTGGQNRAPAEGALVVPHFVGVNSTDLRQMLWRLCSELAAGAGLIREIPTDIDELRRTFPEVLEEAAATRPVVLILDALNQLDPSHGALSMTWLPDRLPENVRVILSTLPSPALDALGRRREPPANQTLHPLTEDDATAIIDQFLERYRKTLDESQREALMAKDDSGSPLYLLTALEEIRTLGIYEEITIRIGALPDRVERLFAWVLKRLEKDEGFRDSSGQLIGRDVVKKYCSYLALGRSGMAQSEMAELVAPAAESSGELTDALGNVAALRALLRPYLMYRGELLDFFHGQIRTAVEERYLDKEEKRSEYQKDIADFFQGQLDPDGDGSCTGDSIRGLSELPYHLTEAEEWDRVTGLLTNFSFLERKAAEVGIVETADAEGRSTKTYTGVYLLQDDYDHALGKMPGGKGASGAQRPIILTPVDFGDGYVIRCPFCNTLVPFQDEWLDQEMPCPEEGCGGPWKVNPFKAVRPTWAEGTGE
jgi:hypothetical protein